MPGSSTVKRKREVGRGQALGEAGDLDGVADGLAVGIEDGDHERFGRVAHREEPVGVGYPEGSPDLRARPPASGARRRTAPAPGRPSALCWSELSPPGPARRVARRRRRPRAARRLRRHPRRSGTGGARPRQGGGHRRRTYPPPMPDRESAGHSPAGGRRPAGGGGRPRRLAARRAPRGSRLCDPPRTGAARRASAAAARCWSTASPRVACVTPARRVAGRSITTAEGLAPEVRAPLGRRLLRHRRQPVRVLHPGHHLPPGGPAGQGR